MVSIFSKRLLACSGEPLGMERDELCGVYTLGMDIVLINLVGREVEFIPVLISMPDVKLLAYPRIVSCCMVHCENKSIRISQHKLTTTFRSVLLPIIIDETSCVSIPDFQ